jgi:23S rRNA pseudouridine1911/1915/1917 synthase
LIRNERFVIPAELGGERLDRGIAAIAGWSRGQAKRCIALGGVYLDRKRVRTASRKLRPGQRLELWWADPPDPEPPPLTRDAVVFRRGGLLALNKPADVHCQGSRHRLAGTLPDMARVLLDARDPIEPIHRLDRHCSGLVVMGETRRARRELSALWQQGAVRKRYLAVLAGQAPERLTIDAPIGLEPGGASGQRGIVEDGQHAVSELRLLSRGPSASLVELEPITGRTHQLRVHCAHIGHPMLGDPWYAPPEIAALAPRLCLHAWRLELPAGAPGTPCSLEAPIPGAMLEVMEKEALAL